MEDLSTDGGEALVLTGRRHASTLLRVSFVWMSYLCVCYSYELFVWELAIYSTYTQYPLNTFYTKIKNILYNLG